MLFPFEKIAADELDERTLRQLDAAARGTRKFMGTMGFGGKVLRGLGRVGMGGARLAGRGMQWAGDQIVQHPTRSLIKGVPVAYAAYKFPELHAQNQKNVIPQYTYQY